MEMKKKIFKTIINTIVYLENEPNTTHKVVDVPYIVWQDYIAVCQRKEQIEKQIESYLK